MTLAWYLLPETIEFSENKINVLIVENKPTLRELIVDIKRQINGESGQLVLSEEYERMEMSKKAALITDLFSIDFTPKRITGNINQTAAEIGNEFSDDVRHVLETINDFAMKINVSMPLDTDFSELEDISALIKLMDYRVEIEDNDVVGRVMEYIKIQRDFFGKNLFVLLPQ